MQVLGSIRTDLEPAIKGLQAGQLVGDQITGTGYTLFKSRVRNSDIQKGGVQYGSFDINIPPVLDCG